MSTTNSDQKLTDIGSSVSDNNNLEMSEHLFDKVLTPSDIGSRILIAKQHAVNYFPPFVNGQNYTVLDFTDRNGRMWRFKYVVQNRRQIYAMARGWSKFVKEKQLVAGDTVSFHRGYIPDDHRPERLREIMCIDWRRKGEIYLVRNFNQVLGVNGVRANTRSPLDNNLQQNLGRSEPLVDHSIPVFPKAREHPSGPSQHLTTKKMRIFGVDVEESSSSGWTSSSAREGDQSSVRLPRGEMGALSSSSKNLSDDENYKRKGKFLEL